MSKSHYASQPWSISLCPSWSTKAECVNRASLPQYLSGQVGWRFKEPQMVCCSVHVWLVRANMWSYIKWHQMTSPFGPCWFNFTKKINTYIHTYMHTYIHTHTRIYNHIYIYKYQHTLVIGLMRNLRMMCLWSPWGVLRIRILGSVIWRDELRIVLVSFKPSVGLNSLRLTACTTV